MKYVSLVSVSLALDVCPLIACAEGDAVAPATTYTSIYWSDADKPPQYASSSRSLMSPFGNLQESEPNGMKSLSWREY